MVGSIPEVWTPLRRTIWLAIAGSVCLWQGPSFVASLRPERGEVLDFFQDWASARNHRAGLPIYLNQPEAIERYLGFSVHGQDRFLIAVNAHPPSSVLLALPLAALDYPDAFLVWSLLSLAALGVSAWLVARQLSLPILPETVAALIALLLVCTPFRAQMGEGQMNLILLLLIVGAWAADRSGRQTPAGVLLGVAVAIKLFPAFLALYFLVQRRWRVLAAAALSFAAIIGVTAAVFGPAVLPTYFNEVLPEVWRFRGGWNNVSLVGFWSRLFDVEMKPEPVVPLFAAPVLARLASAASVLGVAAVTVWSTLRARNRADSDLAFAIAIVGMLLVTPTAWGHYLVLLLLPLVVIGMRLPSSIRLQALFALLLACIWMNPDWLYYFFIPGGRAQGTATPLDSLAVLSVQTYGLMGLLLLGVMLLRKRGQRGPLIAAAA